MDEHYNDVLQGKIQENLASVNETIDSLISQPSKKLLHHPTI